MAYSWIYKFTKKRFFTNDQEHSIRVKQICLYLFEFFYYSMASIMAIFMLKD